MKIKVTDRSAYITEDEVFVSGSVAEYTVQFEFTGAWAGYTKTAVFKTTDGGTIQDVLLGELNTAVVPWEVLEEPGYIQIGIYGMLGSQARPTLWVGPKYVEPGAEPYDRATYPASTPWADALEAVTDAEADAEEAAEDSEAYAKGTRNGEAVGSDDPTYHNNSKYYSEAAEYSAEDSEAYAIGKRGGEDVGSSDPAYHNNSKYYSEQSASSATSAAASAATASAAYNVNLLAPNFVQGNAYPAGQHVINDGGYYVLPNGHEEDVTWANTQKVQVNVGEEVGNLKRALGFDEHISPVWSQGYINSSTGAPAAATDSCYSDKISFGEYKVSVNPGYKLKVAKYSSANVFQGIIVDLSTGEHSFAATEGYYVRVQVTINSGTISPSNISDSGISISLKHYTDETLTLSGKAADAKATGDKIEDALDVLYNGLETTIGFDDIQFTTGYYQKTDGTTEANNNFMISDYIKVFDGLGLGLSYTIHGYNNVGMICLFASDKTTVKRCIYKTTEQDLTGTITFEEGEEYIRFCRWSTSKGSNDILSMQTMMNVPTEIQRIDSEMTVIGDTQWNGKVWHCFGTSISNASSEGKYPPYLVALSGLQYVNFGYSGGKMTQQILAQIKGDSSIANADLITVEGFVNDWSQQSPLGQITDTTADTFCGAIYEAITYILEHSNATLVFITDSTGRNYNSIDIRREAVRNGKTQNDFIEATIKMCNYMGIPVIDAGRKSCISQDTATLYLADQIHHTEKGGEQYARTIWAELKNIKPRIV